MLISAIYLIDEFPHLDYVPWRESVASALQLADELIVVHGGKRDARGGRPAYDYLAGLKDPRVRLLEFPWPADFDWRQIARSCTFGQLHARGEWCFRMLADEVLPGDCARLRCELESAPPDIKVVSVSRWYLLGNRYACPFHEKPLFFRNDRSVGYGTVNPAQGEAASYLLFDDPMDTDHWYDGCAKVSLGDRSILRDPRGMARIGAGETPLGYRGPEFTACIRDVPHGLLNVDVNVLPDKLLMDQKILSQDGYQRLPPTYPHRPVFTPQQLSDALLVKIRGMLRGRQLVCVELSEAMHAFMDRHEPVHNRVRALVEGEHGLPWNRLSKAASPVRLGRTLAANAARRMLHLT